MSSRSHTPFVAHPIPATGRRSLLASRLPASRPLLILAAVALAFGSICQNSFTHWDDNLTIYRNERINPPTLAGVMWYWRHAEASLYIPVTYSAWGALASVAPLPRPDADGSLLNPAVFHAASVLLHCVNALLVFSILRLLLKREWAACAGALFWALHPVQVETVAWASGLKDVLSGFFSLLALLEYLRFAMPSKVPIAADVRWRHFAGAALALTLAMLSKPAAAATPLVALVLDVCVVGRPVRRAALSSGLLFLFVIPWMIIAARVQTGMVVPPVPVWLRPLVATDAIAFYLYNLLLPLSLVPDYGRAPAVAIREGWVYWTWLAPAVAGVIVWRLRKGRPWLAAGLLVFVAALAPVLGLKRFDFQFYTTVADHYLYLAVLGPAMLVAGWFATRRPRWQVLGFGVVLLLLGSLSALQSQYWRDDLTLWRYAAITEPDSVAAHNNLGAAYDRLGPRMYDQALAEYEKAVQLNPRFISGHDNLAVALLRKGRTEESLAEMMTTIRLQEEIGVAPNENMVESRCVLGTYLLRQRRFAEAAALFDKALKMNPHHAHSLQGLQAARAGLCGAATRP